MTLILTLFFAILGISFLCSLLEAVFLSASPAYVSLMVKENRRSGRLLEHLKENIDRPISAILTLNTISHTLGSAAMGALVYEEYGNAGVTAISVIFTFCVLIFAEILPKILGATHWKKLVPFAAYSIQVMIFALFPIVRFSEILGKILARPDTASFTREEMLATAELGVEEGTLHKKESAIIKNLLMLNNMYVSDIMTPRSVMFAMEADETVEDVADKYKPIRFSRIPVYESNMDNIIGLTHRYKILEALSSDEHDTKIREITSPINSVPERMTVAAVIDLFVKRKEHLALAVDEYGIVTGLVTLEDAIETLLGVEIVDEFDNITDMRQYALEQWQIRKNQLRKPS
ncbi:MAG: Mg2+ and Co2+ transporter [Bdellovibrio sp. CG10_big_fil_rev_8_21_14_0_10_47_8]|nr:MAG: Mg2+ and Co2+ transporter [Bdellovibrio sp. CG10_big_fil_rev_8_21_14_0_10_47_8]